MGTPRVSFDIEISDEASGVSIGRLGFVDIDDGAELVEAEHFPGPLVVKFLPAHVFDMTKAEEAIRRSGRLQALPGLILVTGSAESDDAGDLGVLGKAGCRC